MHVSDLRTWGVEVEGQKFKIILCSGKSLGFLSERRRGKNKKQKGKGGGEGGKKVGREQVRLQHQANHSGD